PDRAPSNLCQPTLAGGIADEIGAALEAQFLKSTGPVGLDRLDADVETTGNFLVCESERDQFQHLGFAFGEIVGGDGPTRPRSVLRRLVEAAATILGRQP